MPQNNKQQREAKRPQINTDDTDKKKNLGRAYSLMSAAIDLDPDRDPALILIIRAHLWPILPAKFTQHSRHYSLFGL